MTETGRSSRRCAILLALDASALVVSMFLAIAGWALRYDRPLDSTFFSSYWRTAALMAGIWMVLVLANRLYAPSVSGDLRATARSLLKVAGMSLGCYLLIYFFAPPATAPRFVALIFTCIALGVMGIERVLFLTVVEGPRYRRRVLVIGTAAESEEASRIVRRYLADEYDLIGFVDPDGRGVGEFRCGLRVLGAPEQLTGLARQHRISELLVCPTATAQPTLHRPLLESYNHGVAVVPLEMLYQELPAYIRPKPDSARQEGGVRVLKARPPNFASFGQRFLDTFAAFLGLVSFGVLFPLLAVVMYLYSRWAERARTRPAGPEGPPSPLDAYGDPTE